MKVIDLLNKIANGEEVPKYIKFKNKTFTYSTGTKKYYCDNMDLFNEIYYGEILKEEVDLGEKEIDINNIQELERFYERLEEFSDVGVEIDNLIEGYNNILKAVKQLNKKIKEKEYETR